MTDKMREEFEAWITSPPLEKPVLVNPESSGFSGEYRAYEVQLAWQAWQASRAAVEVELPKIVAYQDDTGDLDADIDRLDGEVLYGLLRFIDVEDAIEAAGLRIKP